MNLGHPNEPSSPQFSPDPSNMSENHNPAPPTVAEAYVASQHGQHLLDALPAFSEELVPLLLSTSQARLMGIGLEQESSNAFAEIVARDAQLSLTVNNEDLLLEGDVYLILWYPRADLRPWNALISSHSTAPTMHSSVSSTWISSPDRARFGNSDHAPAISAASNTNVPFLGHPLLREPGALEEAPALTHTTLLSTLHSNETENVRSAAQVLPSVAEPVEDSSVPTPSSSKHPLPSQQHLLRPPGPSSLLEANHFQLPVLALKMRTSGPIMMKHRHS